MLNKVMINVAGTNNFDHFNWKMWCFFDLAYKK